MKIAEPRNSRSPNYKAFNPDKKIEKQVGFKFDPIKKYERNKLLDELGHCDSRPRAHKSDPHSIFNSKLDSHALNKIKSGSDDQTGAQRRVDCFVKRFSKNLTIGCPLSDDADSSLKGPRQTKKDLLGSGFGLNK